MTTQTEKNYGSIAQQFEAAAEAVWNTAPSHGERVRNIKTAAASVWWFEWYGVTVHAGATPWAGRNRL